MALRLVGGLIFVVGIFLFFGNVLRFFPTFPLAGYLTMALGGFLYRKGSSF